MMRFKDNTIALLASLLVPGILSAAEYGGIDFPQGATSFADQVESYAPVGGVGSPNDNPGAAIGVPEGVGAWNAVSLGDEGILVLSFTDNALTTSGNADEDLWVFETGKEMEPVSVAISTDGVSWIPVGSTTGGTSGVDIDAYIGAGVVLDAKYTHVRLTDLLPNQSGNPREGADIDAVGAISSSYHPDSVEGKIEALQLQVATLEAQLADVFVQNGAHQANASAHHARYADGEAVAAVGPHFSGDHDDLANVTANQHHVPVPSVLDDLLDGVSRGPDPVTGYDTLTFSGVNVQIVNGLGGTRSLNGLGNLIIGYNESRDFWGPLDCPDGFLCDRRSGSHMLVIGWGNNYTTYSGLVVGDRNETSGPWASVVGGIENEASGHYSVVMGGWLNTASHTRAGVFGGQGNLASGSGNVFGGWFNEASGPGSTVMGGQYNLASGLAASISGGGFNVASGSSSSVSGGHGGMALGNVSSILGGWQNIASGRSSTVSGGEFNEAGGNSASISGGYQNLTSWGAASVSGGANNHASAFAASVSGGEQSHAAGRGSSVSGGLLNTANGAASSISGGRLNTATGLNASVSGSNNRDAVVTDCWEGDPVTDC